MLLVTLLATILPAGVAAAEDARPSAPPAPVMEESVEVRARLIDDEVVDDAPPPGVVIVTREDIEASGASSVPELLSRLPAVAAVDEVGNGRQLSLDLRGFSGGTGATALLVDGVRVNDPDTNVAAFEQVRLEDVERIEIHAGPHGDVLGGGSVAGVVRVVRCATAATPAVSASARVGAFGWRDVSATGSSAVGPLSLRASAGFMESDGFRDDAPMDERAARVELEGAAGDLAVRGSWSHLDGSWRQPGALLAEELTSDASLSASNALDVMTADQDLLILRVERPGAAARTTRLLAVVSHRDRRQEILTTGRTGYGFLTRDHVQATGLTFEGSTTPPRGWGRRVVVRYGVEAMRDRLRPRGFATDDVGDGEVDSLTPSSDVRLAWDRLGLFAGVQADLPHGIVAAASARHDRSDVSRAGEQLSFTTGTWEQVSDGRRFADVSIAASVAGAVERERLRATWRASWSESFLAPSSLQLFAYPGYGSNPDLLPQRGRGAALGGVLTRGAVEARLDLFQTDVDDEIAYDAGERENVNVGRTRRRGVEAALALRPTAGVRLEFAHLQVDATFRDAWQSFDGPVAPGTRVPLVPRHRTSLRLRLGPWRGTSCWLGGRHVGASVISGDLDGSSGLLPSHEVVEVGLRHERRGGPVTWAVIATIDNLLDETHATRAVELLGTPYFTPAPPRSASVGIDLSF
jgi:outer membrane receptor protein involved in Fe transport